MLYKKNLSKSVLFALVCMILCSVLPAGCANSPESPSLMEEAPSSGISSAEQLSQTDLYLEWEEEKLEAGGYVLDQPSIASGGWRHRTMAGVSLYASEDAQYVTLLSDGGSNYGNEDDFSGTLEEVPAYVAKNLMKAVDFVSYFSKFVPLHEKAEISQVTINDRDFMKMKLDRVVSSEEDELAIIGYYTIINNTKYDFNSGPIFFCIVVDLIKGGDIQLAEDYADAMAENFEVK